jgi:hypothetical protein
MTIGIGTASIARRTTPERPSASIRTPVTTNAPTISAKLARASAGPRRTVPGMVQKNTSGWRYFKQNAIESSPLRKKAPKIHDAICASLKPPRDPTARMIATGPEIEKAKATIALTVFSTVRSRTRDARSGAGLLIGSGPMSLPSIHRLFRRRRPQSRRRAARQSCRVPFFP